MNAYGEYNCLLEHPTRGFVVRLPDGPGGSFTCCWSKPRSAGLFLPEGDARLWLDHPMTPKGMYILKWTGSEYVRLT